MLCKCIYKIVDNNIYSCLKLTKNFLQQAVNLHLKGLEEDAEMAFARYRLE